MPKNRVTLVLGATHDYAFAAANVLIGLERFSPNLVDRVLIYHNGISEHDKACLNKIRPCSFELYAPPQLTELAETESSKRFSLLSFVPYEVFNLLDSSEYVLFLDCDVVILRDISELLEYTPIGLKSGGYPLNVCLGPNEYGFDDSIKGRSSGVIVAHESLHYKGLADKCYELTVKHWETLKYPDQAIINLALLQNGITPSLFSNSFNGSMDDFVAYRHIHHEGYRAKFWSHGVLTLLSPQWEENNRQWIALGGTPYSGKREMWHLRDMQNGLTGNMFFMAGIFDSVMKKFLSTLKDFLAFAGLRSNLGDHNVLNVPNPGDPTFYFIITLSGKKCVVDAFTKDAKLIAALTKKVKAMPAEQAAEYSVIKKDDKLWLRRVEIMNVRFVTEMDGMAFCCEALRNLALLVVEQQPDWRDYLSTVVSLPTLWPLYAEKKR